LDGEQFSVFLKRKDYSLMNSTLTPAPSTLYAIILKLRPLQHGTLMPFSGELVHGAWLKWLGTAAPDVAAWLHDENKRRLFTCSSLQFPWPRQRMIEAERNNIHMPLDPEKIYTVRITLLLGELFPLVYNALKNFQVNEAGTKQQPFMQLGKQQLALEEVIIDNDHPSDWTGFTSLNTLVEKAKTLRLGSTETLTLEFASLTTFNRSSSKTRAYGSHFARLPLPQYVFPGLAKRWQDIAPPDLLGVIQQNNIEQYIQDDGIIIADYALKTHQVKFTTHPQPGFIGTCKYQLRGPDDATTPGAPLTVRQQLFLLAQLAFYCGVGYKTAMGMGQTHLS
jgi:CRISPR-associated endoribonuclease Cas6